VEQMVPTGAQWGMPDSAAMGRDESGRQAARCAKALHSDPGDPAEEDPRSNRRVTTHCLDLEASADLDQPDAPEVGIWPQPLEVADFTRIAVTGGMDALIQCVDSLRSRGVTLEAIYLGVLGPSASRLGQLWEEDLCDFTEVTIGMGRLHQILRELGPQFRSEIECGKECVNLGRRALLMPTSSEQHTFGLQMVADFFARGGWDVWGADTPEAGDLMRLVREEWFDLVGLNVGCVRRLELLASDIRTIRATSLNPSVCVMVGGPAMVLHPELMEVLGADGMAVDGRQALREAERLVGRAGMGNEGNAA